MRPVLFHLPDWLGGVAIPAHGVFMALGAILGACVFALLARSEGHSFQRAFETMLEPIAAGLIASKVVGLIVHPAAGDSWTETLARTGGIWYVGLLTAVAVAAWRLRRLGMRSWEGLDRAAPAVAIGHAIGRVGCFLAGCCWGGTCELPWAVTYGEAGHRNVGVPAGVPLHPVQLYEVAGELLLGAVLVAVILRRRYRFHGLPTLAYFAAYGLLRFLLEGLRGDPRGGLGPLSTSQWVTAILVPASVAGLVAGWRHGGLVFWRPRVEGGDLRRDPPGPRPPGAAPRPERPTGGANSAAARGRGKR